MKKALRERTGAPGNIVPHASDPDRGTRFFLCNPAAVVFPDSPLRVKRECRHHLDGMAPGRQVLAQAGGKGSHGSAFWKVVNTKDENSHRIGPTWNEH